MPLLGGLESAAVDTVVDFRIIQGVDFIDFVLKFLGVLIRFDGG